jgi:hypothetical protein
VNAAEHQCLLNTFVAAAHTGDLASLERLLTDDTPEEGSHERLAA